MSSAKLLQKKGDVNVGDRASMAAQDLEDAKGLAGDDAWKTDLQKKLERKVSFEFVDTPFKDALTFIRQLADANMVIAPEAVQAGLGEQAISLRVRDMELSKALGWLCQVAGSKYELRNGAVFIFRPAPPEGAAAPRGTTQNDWGDVLVLHLREGLPPKVPPEKLKALLSVAAPKARVAWDEDLRLLIVAADEAAEMRRARVLLQELGVTAPSSSAERPGQPMVPKISR
jgi:hypothetical protein